MPESPLRQRNKQGALFASWFAPDRIRFAGAIRVNGREGGIRNKEAGGLSVLSGNFDLLICRRGMKEIITVDK